MLPTVSYPVLCCPLSDQVAPVFVQIVSSPLDWSSLSSFRVIGSPSGDSRGPSVVFEAVDVPCPGRDDFICLTLLIISYFCPLPDPDVGLSMLVCDIDHTSFHFGLCGRIFVLCLFGQCQMLQEVQIMEEALMIPPAPRPNLQTSRKP